MSNARVYVDEDVHGFVARALRLRGWEVLTTLEAGNSGKSDAAQLDFATREGYALLTYNIGDFAALHAERLGRGGTHHGIILGRQSLRSGNLQPLFRLLSSVSAVRLKDQLVYLSTWASSAELEP